MLNKSDELYCTENISNAVYDFAGPCGGKTTGQARLCTFFENLGWKVSYLMYLFIMLCIVIILFIILPQFFLVASCQSRLIPPVTVSIEIIFYYFYFSTSWQYSDFPTDLSIFRLKVMELIYI